MNPTLNGEGERKDEPIGVFLSERGEKMRSRDDKKEEKNLVRGSEFGVLVVVSVWVDVDSSVCS